MKLKKSSFLTRLVRFCIRPFAAFFLPLIPGSSISFGPPRRFSKTFDELISTKNFTKTRQVKVYPPIKFEATKAVYVPQDLPANLSKEANVILAEQFVLELPEGRVQGTEPTIITDNDTVLGDVSMMFKPYYLDIFFATRLPKLIKISGPVLVLAGCPGSNFGHWLHQMLPRLYLATKAGWSPQQFEKVVINSTRNNFAEESLLSAGFSGNQLMKTSSDLHLQSSCLVVPSLPEAGSPPEWISDFLRNTYCSSSCNPGRRIYASRANAHWRRVSNEVELYPVLAEFGFQVIYPERFNFIEGVRLFEDAEVVCGPHGANLSNICFCKPKSLLVEIYHPQHPEIYYWLTATSAKLRYSFLLGEGPIVDYPDLSPWAAGNHTDIVVSPKKLRDTFIACGL